jgi:hypothetical protein
VSLRKKSHHRPEGRRAILAVYMHALGMLDGAPVANGRDGDAMDAAEEAAG